MNIINRKEAIKKILKYYFTGKFRPQNHLSKRSVHNSTCYECKCESRRKSEKKNNGTRNAGNAKYRSKKLQATPHWSNLEAITKFYKACPKGMVVDHIIPLQGEAVSGLHVLNNLQYLTPYENSVKCNRLVCG